MPEPARAEKGKNYISDKSEMWIETQELGENYADLGNYISDKSEMWIETSSKIADQRPRQITSLINQRCGLKLRFNY